MREIKFRAWDKETKKLYKVGKLEFEGSKLVEVWLKLVEKGAWLPRVPEDVILLQYTGLKDKNRKEICEGDIVKLCLSHFSWLTKGQKPSLYDERICSIEVQNLTAYIVENSDTAWVLDLMDAGYIKREEASIEVIGNIYEHPELLEENE